MALSSHGSDNSSSICSHEPDQKSDNYGSWDEDIAQWYHTNCKVTWTSAVLDVPNCQKNSCRHYGAWHNTNRDIKQTADVTNWDITWADTVLDHKHAQIAKNPVPDVKNYNITQTAMSYEPLTSYTAMLH